jgi:hypothetical protein
VVLKLTSLLLGGAVAGMLVPTMVVMFFYGKIDWTKTLAAPNWDFTRSWASNMTVAGTVLTYTSLVAILDPKAVLSVMPRPGYLVLVSIAGAFAVLAPLAFNVLSRILQAIGRVQCFASSIAFLLSAGITVCGLSLQLLIGTCMVWELKAAKLLPLLLAAALIALLLTLLLGIVWYAILTATDVLKREPAVAPQGPEVSMTSRPEPAAWSLL